MSFSSGQALGSAENIDLHLEPNHDREARILKALKASVEEVVREVGGYVAVSVNGHLNEYEGVGDSINIQINSLLPPAAPVKDAGLEAAGGSPRNFPPEASTAAPATEDNSPPAAQEPIPQPAEVVPPTPEPTESPSPVVPETTDSADSSEAPVESSPDQSSEDSGSDSPEPEQPAAE